MVGGSVHGSLNLLTPLFAINPEVSWQLENTLILKDKYDRFRLELDDLQDPFQHYNWSRQLHAKHLATLDKWVVSAS